MKQQLDKLKSAELKRDYLGLYGEVVTCDTYKLKQLRFVPALVLDIGANIGIFSRFARQLWPQAKIVAVEPHEANCEYFRVMTHDPNTTLIQKALGRGKIYHGLTSVLNGSGETYLSAGLGYPEKRMQEEFQTSGRYVPSTVPTLMLSELAEAYWRPGMKTVLKVDCEGAENVIWGHKPSMDVLRNMDYLAMEIHYYALDGALHPEVVEQTQAALKSLEATHVCFLEGVHFWATKR